MQPGYRNGIWYEKRAMLIMIPLNYVFRNCTGGYKFSESHEKIIHFMYIDGMKVYVRNEKEKRLETLIQTIRIYNPDIEMEYGKKNVPCL